MVVRCIKLVNAAGDPVETSPWLTLEKNYLVLSVIASPARGVSFRIADDSGPGPSLWPSNLFELVSPRVPASWQASLREDGSVVLAPAAMLQPDFWERLFDGDDATVAVYESLCSESAAEESDLNNGSIV